MAADPRQRPTSGGDLSDVAESDLDPSHAGSEPLPSLSELVEVPERQRRLARRHPDIEVARVLVRQGLLEKPAAVGALREQRSRARQGRAPVPFLRQLVKRGALPVEQLPVARDEIRRHTYICDACQARAVVLASQRTRAAVCPRCDHEITVDPLAFSPRAGGSTGLGGLTAAMDGEEPPLSDATKAATIVPQRKQWGIEDALPARPDGRWLVGRYEVMEEIGRGAMGVVYRARHVDLDKEFALKLLLPGEEAFELQVARFRREAAAVQKLRHEGIIAVHDFGQAGAAYYLTMDLIPGADTLHERLKRALPSQPGRDDAAPGLRGRLELLAQVARAVAHAHERGVIHRDLKPGNVLIDAAGKPLVADFGLAKDEDEQAELTQTHDRLGTPLFMAPEQISQGAASVDARADIWALGVMLFVSLTGRYPFRSKTVMDLYLRILREQPDWQGDTFSLSGHTIPFALPAPEDEAGDGGRRDPFARGNDTLMPERIKPGLGSTHSSPETLPSEGTTLVGDHAGPGGALPSRLDAPIALPQKPDKPPPPFVPPPELEGSPLPRTLRAIVDCALAKDPEDRYPQAAQLAEDLERYLAGKPILYAKQPGLLKRAGLLFRRRRVLIPLVLVLAAVVLGGAVWIAADAGSGEREFRDKALREALGRTINDEREYYQTLDGILSRLLERFPEDAEILYHRGRFRLRLLRLDEAGRDLAEAAAAAREVGDQDLSERIELERLLILQIRGDAEGARELARAGLTRAAETLRPGSLAAEVDQDRGPSPLARAGGDAIDRTVRLAAAMFGGAGSRSELSAADLELCEQALAAARGALPKDATRPMLGAARARLALLKGDTDRARERLDREGGRGTLAGLLALAETERRQGHFEESAKLFRESRWAWSPSQRGLLRGDLAYFDRQGYVLKKSGRDVEAVLANRAASALAPFHPRPRYYLGRVLMNARGGSAQALPWLRSANANDPYDPESSDLLLAIYSVDPTRLGQGLAFLERQRTERPWDPTPGLRQAVLLLRQALAKPGPAAGPLDEGLGQRVERLLTAVEQLGPSGAGRAALVRYALGALARPQGGAEPALLPFLKTFAEAPPLTTPLDGPGSERFVKRDHRFVVLWDRAEVARLLVEAGQPRRALALLEPILDDPDELSENFSAPVRRSYALAAVLAARAHARLGDQEAAVTALEEGVTRVKGGPSPDRRLRDPLPPSADPSRLEGYPELRRLADHPRYQRLMTYFEE